ncbi:MAG TPA: BTAD domain-containing putative transcriptional regulator [Actinophytocola sp.]|uniref:AfsR/SARP family transcriptional regulator n=1 Tax=Actinophytocola sp. TaxID=1872138 RepID=UPI002DBA63EB|nr:BTAD domain-containing putative transcriptional regulator [Actinophytocola sp.]HEU5474653.1 BTAD domain-containing putative transcriptional regulator [Actinophytocola sp.]
MEGRAGGRPVNLGPPKQRLVLAALLLEANRPLSTARLVDLTWPDSPPPSARTAIHGRISRLRMVLADAAGDEVALVSQGSVYTLRIDPGAVDAHRFTALLAAARAAPTDELAARRYDEALGLWHGPALDGVTTESVRRELCGNLEEARLQAVDELADVRLRLGMHRDLVELLTGHLAAHPTRERTAGQLALALYHSGRACDALAVCRRTRRRLHEELGVEAGPELGAIEVAILRNDESLAPAVRPAVPAHLPAEAAGFTGRAAEVRRLTELLSDTDPTALPVAVISGPAGVGKSALAVRCGHELAGRFPDGQLHVDLRGFDTGEPLRPMAALMTFLRALGLRGTRLPADQDEAILTYRSMVAGRRILIVLDNAAGAEQVRPLLPGSPSCAVLVTSRDELLGLCAIDGARPLSLDVLTPAESLILLRRLVGTDRVRREPDAAAELTRLCGHLPLALRIAGAHLAARPAEPLEEYARELAGSDRLGTLAISADPRARLGSAFDLSYQALAPATRRVFRRLGLIPGPDFTPAATAALCDVALRDSAAELDRLAAARLIREHAPGRFRFLDLLRLFAAGRGEVEDPPAEREAALNRLYLFYLRHADAAARLLRPHRVRPALPEPEPTGFARPADALAWLAAELPNLTAAVHQGTRGRQRHIACLLGESL